MTGSAMGTGNIRQLEPNIYDGIKYVSRASLVSKILIVSPGK